MSSVDEDCPCGGSKEESAEDGRGVELLSCYTEGYQPLPGVLSPVLLAQRVLHLDAPPSLVAEILQFPASRDLNILKSMK